MTSSSGDRKSLRHVASWSWLISAAAGLRNSEGLFFEAGRAELRVNRCVCCQDAALATAIASFITFLAISTVSVEDGVCNGRAVLSFCTSIIILGRI